MKQLVKVEEVEGEGLFAFMGKSITVFCTSYIWTGILVGVNDNYIKLDDPKVVYETGPLKDASFKDAQSAPGPAYIFLNQIEAFYPGK